MANNGNIAKDKILLQ